MPGHITAAMESTQASGIPVATISGQQVGNAFKSNASESALLHCNAFFVSFGCLVNPKNVSCSFGDIRQFTKICTETQKAHQEKNIH